MATKSARDAAERRLRQRRDRFLSSSSVTVAGFRALAVALGAAPAYAAAVETLWRETHRVHGAASSHRCLAASRLAGAFERRVRGWAADPSLEREERALTVERFASALELALADDAGRARAG